MIRHLLALAGALWLAACGPSGRDWPEPSPALWQVTAPGGQTGWLFGTVHALPEGAQWRTRALDEAIDRSGVLVVEVANLGEPGAAAQAFAAVSTSSGLPPLLTRVPPGDRATLAAAIDKAGLDEAALAQTESWAAALLIANAAREGDTGNGVDRALLASGLPVIGLESHAVQFAMFDRLAAEDQRVLLVETAEAVSSERDRTLAEAWIEGDTAVLEAETQRGILADADLRQALLVGRNRAWAERIAGLIEQGRRPFVAVGAAHMLGPDGLAAILAGRGYAVRRIQ